ncbi:MAG: hypothetical protein LBV04_10100 [Deferribacteraceae bacterium]|nr:hypothetical protein [Deferribacteraceae bacterium]
MRKKVEFAHIIGMMMSAYGCGLQEIMQMPIRAFWALVAEIPKLQNDASLRQIHAINAAVWGNEDYINALADDGEETGSDDALDVAALSKFKGCMR